VGEEGFFAGISLPGDLSGYRDSSAVRESKTALGRKPSVPLSGDIDFPGKRVGWEPFERRESVFFLLRKKDLLDPVLKVEGLLFTGAKDRTEQ
jgi:hypothetical protein